MKKEKWGEDLEWGREEREKNIDIPCPCHCYLQLCHAHACIVDHQSPFQSEWRTLLHPVLLRNSPSAPSSMTLRSSSSESSSTMSTSSLAVRSGGCPVSMLKTFLRPTTQPHKVMIHPGLAVDVLNTASPEGILCPGVLHGPVLRVH